MANKFELVGNVHRFNTGRMYAANGQEIVWGVVRNTETGKTVVAFKDLARGIDQVIDVHVGNLDLLTDRWVLAAYDDFHYRHGYEECRFLAEASR
jgi:hypothetical protein